MSETLTKRSYQLRSDLTDEGFDVPQVETVGETIRLDIRDRTAVAREKVVHYAETHGFRVSDRQAKRDNFGIFHRYQLTPTDE